MAHPDGGGGAPYFNVDLQSVSEAAVALDVLGETLAGDLGKLRGKAINGFGAIPPSDLQSAYGYCWGRWSQALLNAAAALGTTAAATRQAARNYGGTDDVNRAMIARLLGMGDHP